MGLPTFSDYWHVPSPELVFWFCKDMTLIHVEEFF
jgi:hypothetical protein